MHTTSGIGTNVSYGYLLFWVGSLRGEIYYLDARDITFFRIQTRYIISELGDTTPSLYVGAQGHKIGL